MSASVQQMENGLWIDDGFWTVAEAHYRKVLAGRGFPTLDANAFQRLRRELEVAPQPHYVAALVERHGADAANWPILNMRHCMTFRDEEGLLHRVDGPAEISFFGVEKWYWRGMLHRVDAPALVDEPEDYREWWLCGVRLEFTEWAEFRADHDLKPDPRQWTDRAQVYFELRFADRRT